MTTLCLRSCFSDDTFRLEEGDFLLRKLLQRSIIMFEFVIQGLPLCLNFQLWVCLRLDWEFECVIVCPILKVCLLEFENVLKVSIPLCFSNDIFWRFVSQMYMCLSVSIWRYECNCLSLKVCLYVCHFCPCA
jgi:hypothetical protein